MADSLISALAALGGTSVAANDLLVVEDTSATTTKSIRADNLLDAALLLSADGVTLPATTPAQITANQNNYSPGVGPYQRWSADAARTVTGLVAGAAGETRYVWNVGTKPITLSNASGSSSAANRFTCVGGSDIVFGTQECVLLTYDGTTSTWYATKVRSGTAEGTVIIRQPGGTAGTSELQISHDGSNANFVSKAGKYNFYDTDGTTQRCQIYNTFAGYFAAQTGIEIGSASQGGVSRSFTTTGLDLTTTDQVTWRDANFGTKDVGLVRTGVGVARVTNGGSGNGWLQQSGGHKSLDAGPTSVSNTFANSNLAWTLVAGRTYSINLKISGGNSTAAEGAKFTLASDGTLTATTFDLAVVGTNGTVVAGTTRITSLGGTINYTTFTTTSDLWLVGEIKVNVGGVLTLQYATNAHSAGTLTVSAGTWGKVNDMLAV
jgi:hypothetical protein